MPGRDLQLADVLERHRDEIVARWSARATAILGERLEGHELRDGVPDLVDAIARELRRGDGAGGAAEPIARHHARQRHAVRVDLARMLREYGLLQDAILEVAEERGGAPLTIAELRALGAVLDASIAAAGDAYVAERDAAQASLEARLREVADHAPAGVFLEDGAGRYVFANRWMASLLGLPREQLVGRTAADLRPAGAGGDRGERERRAAREGEVLSEDVVPTPRGERVLATVRFPFQLTEDEVGTFAIAVDVTDRRRAERALAAGQARARAILANIRDSIVVLQGVAGDGAEWRFVEANDGALELLGRARDEVVGRTLGELLPDRAETLRPVLARVLESGEPHRYETSYRGRTSMVTVFRIDASTVGSAALDITDRKRSEDAIRAANERLVEADRRKDEFLRMLSHELRNPLAPIRNSVHILQRADPGGEQARRAREVIARQSDHMTRLIDDLLDVTRIGSGKIALRRADVDLGEVVKRTAEDHRSLFSDRGIALEVRVPGAPLRTSGDATRLAQIVGNLLQNAAKFTPAGGRVSVEARAADGRVEVAVRDTGVGVDATVRGQIFEPFVQGDRTLARSGGGLGLGLALVKGIAELHGGGASVESEGPGRGAAFRVWLPSAPPATAPAASAAPPRVVARRRVLVVDDNRDAAESLAELVQAFGHEVEIAHDGPSALARARATPHDFVLCDIGLPGMSGYDVARALREDPGAGFGRLVAVSGYAQPEDQRRAAEAGFDLHVAKPPDPGELERLLSR
ncbi:MAG TPA: ATP-binding protein [Anaeromyxobacter sp.]